MSKPDIVDCPFCKNRLVWADALIFGCAQCGAEFTEEDTRAVTFEPELSEE